MIEQIRNKKDIEAALEMSEQRRQQLKEELTNNNTQNDSNK